MTRHQRRKRARLISEARKRQEIVRRNLGAPLDVEHSGRLVSHVYRGDAMDRARGFGVTPMTRPVGGYRVLNREGNWTDALKE